ncbi:ATV_HP_G0153870.mRNA.1.CDS.1 [Saccharomyces cerevisiae]|nr:ATV_HP_G0153870.mRNA.1.CDS.1 [Saccharomyces cerevisiae]CAI6932514.1 ATV_HP_G0153870.mRNA.1.CDS.1 [Saccharomyces cerevisiae]
MGNSKTNGFFTPEKYLYGIIQGLPLTLRGLAFIFFLVAFYFFPAFWDLCGVLRGARQRIPKTEIRRQ